LFSLFQSVICSKYDDVEIGKFISIYSNGGRKIVISDTLIGIINILRTLFMKDASKEDNSFEATEGLEVKVKVDADSYSCCKNCHNLPCDWTV
jgi:hypothetical protein